jgi:hypothetical protein
MFQWDFKYCVSVGSKQLSSYRHERKKTQSFSLVPSFYIFVTVRGLISKSFDPADCVCEFVVHDKLEYTQPHQKYEKTVAYPFQRDFKHCVCQLVVHDELEREFRHGSPEHLVHFHPHPFVGDLVLEGHRVARVKERCAQGFIQSKPVTRCEELEGSVSVDD